MTSKTKTLKPVQGDGALEVGFGPKSQLAQTFAPFWSHTKTQSRKDKEKRQEILSLVEFDQRRSL